MAIRDALGRFASEAWSNQTDTGEMVWSVVRSSNVAAVGYNAGTSQLGVSFNNGSTYYYEEVPEEIYDAFLASASKGKFMWAMVRDHYRYERVS